jgi:hypothetical protein
MRVHRGTQEKSIVKKIRGERGGKKRKIKKRNE